MTGCLARSPPSFLAEERRQSSSFKLSWMVLRQPLLPASTLPSPLGILLKSTHTNTHTHVKQGNPFRFLLSLYLHGYTPRKHVTRVVGERQFLAHRNCRQVALRPPAMKSDRSVKWADPLSRLRYAPSPTISSAGSEGGATTASSTGEEPVHTQQPDGLASSSSTSGCFRCGSPATSGVLSGQHLLSRRFRCAATEAEYLEWHFSIWGRRSMVKRPANPPSGLERTRRTTRAKRPA
jgi:hypothetical protein